MGQRERRGEEEYDTYIKHRGKIASSVQYDMDRGTREHSTLEQRAVVLEDRRAKDQLLRLDRNVEELLGNLLFEQHHLVAEQHIDRAKAL